MVQLQLIWTAMNNESVSNIISGGKNNDCNMKTCDTVVGEQFESFDTWGDFFPM